MVMVRIPSLEVSTCVPIRTLSFSVRNPRRPFREEVSVWSLGGGVVTENLDESRRRPEGVRDVPQVVVGTETGDLRPLCGVQDY